MYNTIKVLALEITPKGSYPDNTFYVLKMSAQTLAGIAHVPVRLPTIRRGTQRPTDIRRLQEIAAYISRDDAMFPNTIIVNFKGDVEVSKADALPGLFWLAIPLVEKSAVIIDGQHRLLGIERAGIDLDILVTAFLGISEEKQAAIFRDINFYQRKVNKSLMYDLFHVAKDAGYPLMRALDLTEKLNEEGPLQGMIKLTGVGPGVVTQTVFVETLQSFLEEGEIFREPEYDKESSFEIQSQVIRDFFDTIRGHYRHVWEDPRNYILLKTQGVYASLMLLRDLLQFFLQERSRHVPHVLDFEPFISNLARGVTFSSEEYGDAYLGATGQRRLHRHIKEMAFVK